MWGHRKRSFVPFCCFNGSVLLLKPDNRYEEFESGTIPSLAAEAPFSNPAWLVAGLSDSRRAVLKGTRSSRDFGACWRTPGCCPRPAGAWTAVCELVPKRPQARSQSRKQLRLPTARSSSWNAAVSTRPWMRVQSAASCFRTDWIRKVWCPSPGVAHGPAHWTSCVLGMFFQIKAKPSPADFCCGAVF